MSMGTPAGSILRELGDGLIVRRARPDDAAVLAVFHADVHRHAPDGAPDEQVGAWVADLMRGDHPTFSPADFTLVEDTRTGAIVSSLNLIPQTWSYAGVEFAVGRVELVGTHPDYRRRGLVRAQFEVIHEWGAKRGQVLQAITGIPYYYRQFGYEMALNLGGGRIGYRPHIPRRAEDETEPFHIRQAVESDLAFVAHLYEHGAQRHLVACVRDRAAWRHELLGKSEQNVNRVEFRVIEGAGGEPVGFFVHSPWLWGPTLAVSAYELKPGASWLAVTPSVLRYLLATGETYAARDRKQDFGAFYFHLGAEHPVYEAISNRLPKVQEPYAYYIRIAKLSDFLWQIKPVLEERLRQSVVAGHTGGLKISFYRQGIELAFERGRLVRVAPWLPTPTDSGDAGFPDLTFLQLVLGYRSLDELKHAFADCWTDHDEARALLSGLFPKQPSDVWPMS